MTASSLDAKGDRLVFRLHFRFTFHTSARDPVARAALLDEIYQLKNQVCSIDPRTFPPGAFGLDSQSKHGEGLTHFLIESTPFGMIVGSPISIIQNEIT